MGFFQILRSFPNLVSVCCQIILNKALSLQGVIEYIAIYLLVVKNKGFSVDVVLPCAVTDSYVRVNCT